jgi:hypothetical protein
MIFTVLPHERFYFVQVIKNLVGTFHSFARNMTFQTDHVSYIGQFAEDELGGTYGSHR